MGDIFHEKSERDLFFSSFATDLGSQLDQLRSEYDAIENGTIKEEPDNVTEDSIEVETLENKVQNELMENNVADGENSKEPSERTRTYTMTIQRAFSTLSLMTNFKSNFWKRRHGKGKKSDRQQRRGSTSSNPEKNNNRCDISDVKINGQSEGRATIYSTVPRPGKNIKRQPMSQTAPNTSMEPAPLDRDEQGNAYVPPIIMNGRVTYEYQHATPESSPLHESARFRRGNSLTRLLRIRRSQKKSPKKDKSPSPIKVLYEKTIHPANGNGVINGDVSSQKNGIVANDDTDTEQANAATEKSADK